MLILSISHHIYLTREQRYALINGENVEVMGISVPVWVKDQGVSTEPAVEVFCNYTLTNSEKIVPISIGRDGYKINMPQLSEHDKAEPEKLSDEIWRSLSVEEREEYYANQPKRPCADWLRDINDKGSQHLRFREHNKIYQDKKALEVYHYIQIDDISSLTETLC